MLTEFRCLPDIVATSITRCRRIARLIQKSLRIVINETEQFCGRPLSCKPEGWPYFVFVVCPSDGCVVAKRCKIGPRLLLITNRKSHIGF